MAFGFPKAIGSAAIVTQDNGVMFNLTHEKLSELVLPASIAVGDKWFAIHTRPRHEKTVAAALQEKGIDAFLPLFSAKHQWSDRRRIIQLPLFPSYVFIRIAEAPDNRISVLRTSGVLGFVGVRGIGVPIPDDQIKAVQAIVKHGIPFTPHPFLDVGQRVRICGGSLDGIQGILLAKKGDHSLIVSVKILQRSLDIRITGYGFEPI